MPVAKAPDFLRSAHIAILLELWKDIHTGCKGGLDRRQLRKLLVTESDGTSTSGSGGSNAEPGGPERAFKSKETLFAQLGNLKKLTNLVHTKQGFSGGKPKDVYTIMYEQAITWPTTARIVVEIYDADDQSIEEDILVRRILAMSFKRTKESTQLSEPAVRSAVKWACQEERKPPYLIREDDILIATRRLRFEIDYLKAIAEHCSRNSDTP